MLIKKWLLWVDLKNLYYMGFAFMEFQLKLLVRVFLKEIKIKLKLCIQDSHLLFIQGRHLFIVFGNNKDKLFFQLKQKKETKKLYKE
jgi:hypothetical protein